MAIDFIKDPGPEHLGVRNRTLDYYIPAEEKQDPLEERALAEDRARLVAERAEFERIKAEAELIDQKEVEVVVSRRKSKKAE